MNLVTLGIMEEHGRRFLTCRAEDKWILHGCKGGGLYGIKDGVGLYGIKGGGGLNGRNLCCLYRQHLLRNAGFVISAHFLILLKLYILSVCSLFFSVSIVVV